MGLGYLNADGTIDLIVSMRYDATAGAPSLARWECMLDEASKLLHQATGGTARLGKVYFANNLAGSMAADLCAFDDTATGWDAPAQTCGPFGFDEYLGAPGFAVAAGPDGVDSPYLMLHELGHYAFALMDEVVGGVLSCTGDELAPGCIMEFRTAGFGASVDDQCNVTTPQFTNKTRFCTPVGAVDNGGASLDTEHLAGGAPTNPQHDCHGESCVETIEAFTTALGTPIAIPVPTQDPAIAAPPIDWIEMDQTPRIVLALDRSASMAANNAVTGVREAAKYWINLEATLGHRLAIVAYHHDATQIWPTVGDKVVDLLPGHVANAEAAVDAGVVAAGSTDIAEALAASRFRITPMPGNTPDLAASQAIVLFTDGHQTVPGDPLDEVAALREKFIRVFPIGMGPDAAIDKPVLQQIADGTRGTFQQILDPDAPIDPDLPDDPVVAATAEIMDATIYASAVLHSGLALVQPSVLRVEDGGEETYGFFVEEGAEAVTIVVRRTATDAVDLAVTPPGEDSYVDAGDYPERGMRSTDPPGSPFTLLVAEAPAAGEWQVRVRSDAADDAPVKVFAFISNKRFVVGLLGAEGVYDIDEAPRLVARVNYGGTVAGLTTAVVRDPDGEEVVAFEEGPPGTYVATLPTRDPGTHEYFVELGNDGTAELVRPHDAPADPEQSPPALPVPPFRRLERVLIRVERLPDEVD